ncbi:PspC domain-containing protein [Microbacterium sp. NPDC057650]|uniref:PspC domain-containing protein n=1 Tax=unclassified Microbacterium TaxID=2609290 RepID=UPI00366BFDB4
MHSSVPGILPRPPRVAPPPRPPLERDRECVVSGVSAGLARHLGAPVWAIRSLFVVLGLLGGVGVLLYVWCWVLMPWQAGEKAPSRQVPIAWVLLALAGAALFVFLVDGWYPWVYGAVVGDNGLTVLALPACLVLGVAAGIWSALVDQADPARGPRHSIMIRAIAVAMMVILFLILALRGVMSLVLLLPLLAIAVVLSSTLYRRWRELSGERIRRIREEQRSEMAAHLHDSVLQTLALIQNRAGPSSEAARLARAQERELRAWLYDGDSPADSDLPTDLRDYAGALELDYPVRIDVVSAGLSAERASGEVAAAAREAMLNAARHAGGEVSVYIEGSASGVDVFIRDRGAGFELDGVPSDRLGVRESIIGRMRRAGGSATVRSSEQGTEVHLKFTGVQS